MQKTGDLPLRQIASPDTHTETPEMDSLIVFRRSLPGRWHQCAPARGRPSRLVSQLLIPSFMIDWCLYEREKLNSFILK